MLANPLVIAVLGGAMALIAFGLLLLCSGRARRGVLRVLFCRGGDGDNAARASLVGADAVLPSHHRSYSTGAVGAGSRRCGGAERHRAATVAMTEKTGEPRRYGAAAAVDGDDVLTALEEALAGDAGTDTPCAGCCHPLTFSRLRLALCFVAMLSLLVWHVTSAGFAIVAPTLPAALDVRYDAEAFVLSENASFVTGGRLPTCAELGGGTVGFVHPMCSSDDAPSSVGRGSGHVLVAVLGCAGATVAQKCCAKIAAPLLESIATASVASRPGGEAARRSVLAALPSLSSSAMRASGAARNRTTAALLVRTCPQLPGRFIPQGFAAIAISSIIGTLVNIFLNLVEYLRDRYCPMLSVTVCVTAIRRWWNPEEHRKRMYGRAGATNDAPRSARRAGPHGGRQNMLEAIGGALPLYCRLFGVGGLQVAKTVLTTAVGFGLACYTAVHDGGDAWDSYQALFTMLINGSTTQNIIDLTAAIIVSELFVEIMYRFSTSVDRSDAAFTAVGRYLFSSTHDDVWTHAHDTIAEEPWATGLTTLLLLLVYLCPLVTHWLCGALLFAIPVLLLCAMFASLGAAMVFAIYRISRACSCWNGVSLSACLLLTSITINFILTILVRFPFNLAVMLGGSSTYTRMIADPGMEGFANPRMFWGAAWFDSVFYLIQMGSHDCYFLQLYTSLHHGLDIALTFI